MRASAGAITRFSGLATVFGGLLWALGGTTALNAKVLGIGMEGPHLVLSVAGLLSLIGLARLASHQAVRYGLVGIAGVLLLSAGVLLVIVSKNLPPGTSSEVGWTLFDVGGLLLVIGSLVSGSVALLVRRTWLFGGPLLAIGGLVVLQLVFLMVPGGETGALGTVVLPVLIGLAWTALGYALWSKESQTVGRVVWRAPG